MRTFEPEEKPAPKAAPEAAPKAVVSFKFGENNPLSFHQPSRALLERQPTPGPGQLTAAAAAVNDDNDDEATPKASHS